MVPAVWPGSTALNWVGVAASVIMGWLLQLPPSGRDQRVTLATRSGSLALTLTVTGANGAGTAGSCLRPVNVGPLLWVHAVFVVPGVPVWGRPSRMVVRASRLKYSRVLS